MCSHSEYIEDHTSGDVVCLTCGLVLDKIFLSSQKKDFDYSCVYNDKFLSKNVKEIDLHENVTNFLFSTANLYDLLSYSQQLLSMILL